MTERIDAHHHVWDHPGAWTAPFPVLRRPFGVAELRPLLAAAGIGGTVLVHTVADRSETVELLALAAANPEIRGVVGWVDLTGPDVAEQISVLTAGPGGDRLVGVRHQLQEEPDPGWLSRSDVHSGLEAVGRAGLVYDVVVSPSQLPVVLRTVRALPGVRFVLDHAGKPPLAGGDLTDWGAAITELAAHPNVAVKLSGLVTEADWATWTVDTLRPVAVRVLDAFSPARTMIGSDWPVCLLAAGYGTVLAVADELTAGLAPAELDAVRGGTARDWYGL